MGGTSPRAQHSTAQHAHLQKPESAQNLLRCTLPFTCAYLPYYLGRDLGSTYSTSNYIEQTYERLGIPPVIDGLLLAAATADTADSVSYLYVTYLPTTTPTNSPSPSVLALAISPPALFSPTTFPSVHNRCSPNPLRRCFAPCLSLHPLGLAHPRRRHWSPPRPSRISPDCRCCCCRRRRHSSAKAQAGITTPPAVFLVAKRRT